MREKTGEIFSIAKDNPPIDGCTVSREAAGGDTCIVYFSMGTDTDISAEIYPCHKLLIVAEGAISVYGTGEVSDYSAEVSAGSAIITPVDAAVGIRTNVGAIYTEISVGRDNFMNERIKAGEAFKLKELVPYKDNGVVNMDILHNEKMKFVVMSFDEGAALSEHAAPGEALIFALEGEAEIRYEGKDNLIREGENFHFAKGGLHSLKAVKRFKMALLITLE